jgi:hypothetical protein
MRKWLRFERKTSGRFLICGLYERPQRFKIPCVVSQLVLRGFQQESCVRKTRVASDPSQGFAAYVAQAYVPVPVYAGVIVGPRIVKVNGAHVPEADLSFERFKSGGKPVLFAYVVPGGESMRCVQTNAQVKLGASLYNLPEMLEAMAYALALPRGIFQQNAKAIETQTFARHPQALSAGLYGIGLARAPRAAGMYDQIVSAERQPPLHLFAERGARLPAYGFIGRSQIYKIVAVYDNGRNLRLAAQAAKALNLFICQGARGPAARVARKHLNGVRAQALRLEERVVQAAGYRRVKAYAW